MFWRLFMSGLILLYVHHCHAELIVDDFRGGQFSIHTAEPYGDIQSIDTLTSVFASERYVRAGDNQGGETAVSVWAGGVYLAGGLTVRCGCRPTAR